MRDVLPNILGLRPAHHIHVRDNAVATDALDKVRELVVVEQSLNLDLLRLAQVTLFTERALPIALLEREEEARLADSLRVEKRDLNTQIETTVTAEKLDCDWHLLVLDFVNAAYICDRLDRLVLNQCLFFVITVLSITLVQFHRRQVQKECLEVEAGNKMELRPCQVLLVEAKESPDLLVGQLTGAKHLPFLILAQAKRVQSLTLDDKFLLLSPVCHAP